MIKVSTAVREVYPDVKFGIMKAYGFQENTGIPVEAMFLSDEAVIPDLKIRNVEV